MVENIKSSSDSKLSKGSEGNQSKVKINELLSKDPSQTEFSYPLYKKVKNFILKQIRSGNFKPGECIPSENTIVKQMQVSRSTVSRALRELTMEGFLNRIQGVGTFVASKKSPIALLEIKSIAKEIIDRGGVYSCEVLLLREEVLSKKLSADFHMPEGYPVFHSILIHRDSGIPVQLADRYINPLFAPEYLKQDFTTITPSDYLFQLGPVSEAEHIIEAIMPNKKTCQLLKIDQSEPCLVLHRRAWSNNVLSTKAQFTYPASRIKLGSRYKPNFS